MTTIPEIIGEAAHIVMTLMTRMIAEEIEKNHGSGGSLSRKKRRKDQNLKVNVKVNQK